MHTLYPRGWPSFICRQRPSCRCRLTDPRSGEGSVEVADGTEANRWRSLNMMRRNRFAAVGTCGRRWLRRPRFLASTSFGRKPASTRYRLHRTVTADGKRSVVPV